MELNQNEAETAKRKVRVRLSMHGGDIDEYMYMLEQAKILACKITSTLNRKDANII